MCTRAQNHTRFTPKSARDFVKFVVVWTRKCPKQLIDDFVRGTVLRTVNVEHLSYIATNNKQFK